MFEIEKEYKSEYERETEFASINTQEEDNSKKRKSIQPILISFLIVSTVGVMGYFGFNYIQKQPEPIKDTAVMGATHYSNKPATETPTVNYTSKNEIEKGLEDIVEEVHIKETIESIVTDYIVKEKVSNRESKDISKELDGMVDSFYTQKAIPMELGSMVDDFYTENIDSSDDKKRRVVIVKEGDTLANISKRFYGDYMSYQKIIAGNRKLKESSTLHIGQKLNIPY